MADQKITQLPLLTGGVAGTDVLPIVDDPGGSPITKRITVTDLLNASLMPNTPAGNIAANTVQAAINELDTEKAAKVASPTNGNLAGVDASGNLVDAGVSAASFLRLASWTYDPAVNGGAIGTYTLAPERGAVPANAIIWTGFIDRLTSLTAGAGATIAFQLEAANDLKAADAFTNYTAPGRTSILPNSTATSTIKTTTQRNAQITIATNAITAGKLRLVVFYLVSAP